MQPFRDEEIESYNNKKFCHICKMKFHDVHNRDINSNHTEDDIMMRRRNLISESSMVMS